MAKPVYVDLSNGKSYSLRLVGAYVKFHRSKSDGKVIHPEGLPPERYTTLYAVHALDRTDGQLKLLEADIELFTALSNYMRNTGVSPSGRVAPNFLIRIAANGSPIVSAIGEPCELSQAELELCRANKAALAEIYASR